MVDCGTASKMVTSSSGPSLAGCDDSVGCVASNFAYTAILCNISKRRALHGSVVAPNVVVGLLDSLDDVVPMGECAQALHNTLIHGSSE